MLYKVFWIFNRRRFFGKKPTFRDYLSHLQGLDTLKMGQRSSPETLFFFYQKTTPGKNPKDFIQLYDRLQSHKIQGISCLADQLSTSVQGLCSLELVNRLRTGLAINKTTRATGGNSNCLTGTISH
jgi:hypothetical protein